MLGTLLDLLELVLQKFNFHHYSEKTGSDEPDHSMPWNTMAKVM